MTVAARIPLATDLPLRMRAVDRDGLLAHVRRPCREHGGECACVARDVEEACLVFWCERGEHHFSKR